MLILKALLYSENYREMKNCQKPLVDLSKIKINPNLKSHRDDPFVVRKVEEAKRVLATLKKPLDEYYN